MPRASHVCTTAGCPTLTTGGQCQRCERAGDAKRGTKKQRGYSGSWAKRRSRYLRRHPTCVLCGGPADVPDHWPKSRKELVTMGVADPDADEHVRPLCVPCHNVETAQNQPGGWNAW